MYSRPTYYDIIVWIVRGEAIWNDRYDLQPELIICYKQDSLTLDFLHQFSSNVQNPVKKDLKNGFICSKIKEKRCERKFVQEIQTSYNNNNLFWRAWEIQCAHYTTAKTQNTRRTSPLCRAGHRLLKFKCLGSKDIKL